MILPCRKEQRCAGVCVCALPGETKTASMVWGSKDTEVRGNPEAVQCHFPFTEFYDRYCDIPIDLSIYEIKPTMTIVSKRIFVENAATFSSQTKEKSIVTSRTPAFPQKNQNKIPAHGEHGNNSHSARRLEDNAREREQQSESMRDTKGEKKKCLGRKKVAMTRRTDAENSGRGSR